MGLDMYLMRCKKAKPEIVAAINNTDEFSRGFEDIMVYEPDETTCNLDPYSDPVTIIQSRINMDRIRKAFDIPSDMHIIGSRASNYDYHMAFADNNGNRREVDIDNARMTTDFTDKVKVKMRVCESHEIHYWRKAYGIQEALYARHDIQNCGFYLLDDDDLDMLEDMDESLVLPRCRKGEAIFYHEWY